MQVKLIILDFDGTLADTASAHLQAYIRALKEEGIALSAEEYRRRFFGMRYPEFMRSLGLTDEAQIERVRRRKIELYPTLFDSIGLNIPLWNFVQSCRQEGCKVWIASTGQWDNICNAMRYLGIEGMVDGVLTSNDVARPKPSPDIFLKAMQVEGVTPSETLIFEDSEIGLEAARASGAAYFKVKL